MIKRFPPHLNNGDNAFQRLMTVSAF